VALTVPLTACALAGIRWLPFWGFEPEVLRLTTSYLGILTWSLLPLLLYAALRRYLQSMNLVRPVMVALVSANLINVAANWVLVFGRLGAPALGVDGAAWATCISRVYLAGLLLGAIVLRHGRALGNLPPRVRRIELSRLWRLVGLGLPAAMQVTLEVGVFAAVTALAGRLAAETLAAHQIVLNVASMTFMVPLGLASAAAVRVGQAVGRGDAPGAASAGWTALALGAAFMASAAATFVLWPERIVHIFSDNAAVVRTGVVLLFIAAAFQLFDGLQGVATGVLRGLGDTRTPMMCNLAGHWLIGLPIAYALCFEWNWGVTGLWVGVSTGLILVGLALVTVWHVRVRAMVEGPRATAELAV